MQRVCRRHGLQNHAHNGRRYVCSACNVAAVIAHRQRRKAALVEERGGCCGSCGYARYAGALHFHHRERVEKSFALSVTGQPRAFAAQREEIARCDLLCGNCHGEREHAVHERLRLAWAPPPADGVSFVHRSCQHHGQEVFRRVSPTSAKFVCTRCKYEREHRLRFTQKAALVTALGDACVRCAYRRCLTSLHFHHRDKKDKCFSIGTYLGRKSMEELLTEARKCALLCTNCHAETEAGLLP